MAPQANHETARLRAALRDPATLVTDKAAALAAFVLRSHALEQLAEALARSKAPVLLVKGAALALTVYPEPWQRGMCDIDLLVRPSDHGQVVAALERAGCRPAPAEVGQPRRPWSSAMLGETPLVWQAGSVRWMVEVHTMLDKVVSRPVAYADVFARARPAPDLPRLQIPNAVDHALLVALHAAVSGFRHPVGLVDLELLIRAGLDLEELTKRAHQWKLRTSLFVAFAVMRRLEAPSVTPEMVERFYPGRLRRAALDRSYDLLSYPPARGAPRLGWPWIAAQTPLRDDLFHWCEGVARYALVRAAERVAGWQR